MKSMKWVWGLAAALALPTVAAAQTGGTDEVAGGATPPPGARGEAGWAEVVAGPRYDAGVLQRLLLGDGWRHVWLRTIRVPVLDLERFAGGLEPVEQGGGNQSITLHFEAEDGREYVFRSTDKFIEKALPEDAQNTIINRGFQDAVSNLYPAGAIAVSELLDVTDILHARPWPVVMPDDARLGEYRETFAGMLGTIEETPNEGEGDVALFEGARTVAGSETFLEHLEETPAHRLDRRAYVKARLFDYIIGDTDRGADQWRWARYDAPAELREAGVEYLWQPIPRDRDWAFVDAGGWLVTLAAKGYPKLVSWDASYPSGRGLNFSSWELDRRLMPGVPWPEWQAAARELQASLTDQAIEAAIRSLPEPWVAESADELIGALKARRDNLLTPAREYYDEMAAEPDLHGTDEADRAEIVRNPDGSVDVRLYAAEAARPYFSHRFPADETDEIRLDLHGGDDRAAVTGQAGTGSMIVRIEGGGGDDVLEDRGTTRAWHPRTVLYDDRGDNRLEGGPLTWIDTDDYDPPAAPSDWIVGHTGGNPRDWGETSGFSPRWGYGEGAGIILGAGWTRTRYGFRADPFLYRYGADVLYATRDGGFGVRGFIENTLRNSDWSLGIAGSAVQFDAFRFYGYGNETPDLADEDDALVLQDRIEVDVAAIWRRGPLEAAFGPRFVLTDPRYDADAPVAGLGEFGAYEQAHAGAAARLEYDRSAAEPTGSGLRAWIGAEGYPAGRDLPGEFGTAGAELSGSVALPLRAALAARVGGRHAFGDFPVQEAATIGGRESVRGYRYQRYTGESSAYGSAELRLELFDLELLTKGRLGVLGFADAGRVWVDGEESDVWHDGYGGGLWYSTLGRTLSLVYGYGDEGRLYLNVGMPF